MKLRRSLAASSHVPTLVGLFYLSLGQTSRGFSTASAGLHGKRGRLSNVDKYKVEKRPLIGSWGQYPFISRCEATSGQRSFTATTSEDESMKIVLPFQETSHRSATILIPEAEKEFASFSQGCIRQSFEATVQGCRALGKSSIWVHVPMKRCAIIEDAKMESLGFHFHHTKRDTVVLNIWLDGTTDSKIPEFATHNVGVGAVVINSRGEILCVRELRKNYMPWKTPTGLSDIGESINEAAVREVMEETGIATTFRRILSFRQTHGMAHDRSDLYFVCQLDPIEARDESGNAIIAEPTPEASEIARAEWIPLSEYRAMVNDETTGGHPMMQHVLEVLDTGRAIDRKVVQSVVPGRAPNAMYFPN